MKRILAAAAAAAIITFLSIALPASAQEANTDPMKWAWTCKSSGYYSVKVFPNVSYKPETDFTSISRVIINIREPSKETADYCGTHNSPKLSYYYAEMQGNDLAKLCSTWYDRKRFCNEVTTSFDHSTLNEVSGSSNGMSFFISRDDNDWTGDL